MCRLDIPDTLNPLDPVHQETQSSKNSRVRSVASIEEGEKILLQDSHPKEKRMIIIVKTPGSQVGSPAAAETRGEVLGWGVVESGQ
mmetsp:Transcript_44297/g.71222  ORF Transcript_44297/g.71222 Transcript_44297/m.71222 type:complete len:86 (+) Transcript_44297:63-320(+)